MNSTTTSSATEYGVQGLLEPLGYKLMPVLIDIVALRLLAPWRLFGDFWRPRNTPSMKGISFQNGRRLIAVLDAPLTADWRHHRAETELKASS
jgi:hypothetical protein